MTSATRERNLAGFGVTEEGLITDWVAEGELEGVSEEMMAELSAEGEKDLWGCKIGGRVLEAE